MVTSMEIRLHGRGGQGGVTCAKILAGIYARLGKSVQTFGDYAGERSGAPVRAYTRVDDAPIHNRNKVYEPDHLVVLDPTLLSDDVVAGLAFGGTLLLNTPDPVDDFVERFGAYRLATVDATAIARKHGIGTRSVVIVNTTIAGAFARAHDVPFEMLEKTYLALGFGSNLDAAREAYDAVQIRESEHAFERRKAQGVAASAAAVVPLADHTESEPTGLRTGVWGTQRPHYVESLAPCNAWCPAGNDVVGFIQALASEGEVKAAEVLGRSTPLAAVCGRVCPAPCMEGCNRKEYDGSLNIRGLERWIADRARVAVRAGHTQPAGEPLRIAIVGGGPAGLSAAYTIAREGHHSTIFEREHVLGGVLRTGIPEYRLPRGVVEREIEDILALGVDVKYGVSLDHNGLRELVREHDAVIVATGLQRLRGLDVDGAELAGIEQGIHFLHRVNVDGGVEIGGRVIVLGGGNTAMDCARSALRAGASEVVVAYRRTRGDMPAIREEIDEAEHEGIDLLLRRAPVGFRGNGRVDGVVLAEVDMGEADETGRRRPLVSDRTYVRTCDHVLLALGQSADLSWLPPEWQLRDGRVFEGDVELPVFAAGDVATGDGTVTHALGSGRRAAGLALSALGRDVEVFERPDRRRSVPITDIRLDHFERREPARDELVPEASRTWPAVEVNRGLGDPLEAERCFSCGHCTRCDTCLVYCPEGIIRREAPGYEVDYSYCKGCGICVEECPRGSIEMRPT